MYVNINKAHAIYSSSWILNQGDLSILPEGRQKGKCVFFLFSKEDSYSTDIYIFLFLPVFYLVLTVYFKH